MKGTVEIREVDAPSLVGNPLGDPARKTMPVYLPPGYAEGKERFPVFYVLHGFSGSGRNAVNFAGFSLSVPERLDGLISSGAMPPVIAVFVDGWNAIGGSQWINSEATGRYGDYLAHDVVGFMDRTFRTVPHAGGRACIGTSSGGYGAMAAGRDHPDVFGHIASHSGDAYFEYCYLGDFPKAVGALLKVGSVQGWFRDFWQRAKETKARGDDFAVLNVLAMAAAYSPKQGESMNLELPFDLETARLREDVWARWLEKDPVRFIPKNADSFRKLRTVFVDCGTRDEFNLRWGARMMAQELRKIGVDVTHEEFEDGHMGTNYRYARSFLHITPRMDRS